MITLIDNYDSFTYNLQHLIEGLGHAVKVYRNDELSAKDVIAEKPKAVFLSPGPCSPSESGICLDVIDECVKSGTPLYGVCLGFQAIAQYFGGTVCKAPTPVHGKASMIKHTFEGLPNPLQVTRYHSLMVKDLPNCLEENAWTDDGVIMGVKHKVHIIQGVQFHPESILTKSGQDLIKMFLKRVI